MGVVVVNTPYRCGRRLTTAAHEVVLARRAVTTARRTGNPVRVTRARRHLQRAESRLARARSGVPAGGVPAAVDSGPVPAGEEVAR